MLESKCWYEVMEYRGKLITEVYAVGKIFYVKEVNDHFYKIWSLTNNRTYISMVSTLHNVENFRFKKITDDKVLNLLFTKDS